MTYARRRGDFTVAASLLGLTLLLGGGSVLFPIQRMIVELTGVLALGWYCALGWRASGGRAAYVGLLIVALTFVLILAQLIPLPPGLWHVLPGRALPASIEATIGAPGQWLPISLDPAATWATLFYFIVPAVIFLATLHLNREGQRRLLALFATFAMVNGLIVALQAQGVDALTLYWIGPGRPGFGLFANKNHCAIMLVAAMPAAVTVCQDLLRAHPRTIRHLANGVVLTFLALTVFGCLSRAALALMPIGIGAALLIIGQDRLSLRMIAITVAASLAVIILAYLILPRTQIAAEALSRFNSSDEGRYEFWPDVIAAIRSYFPIGSGLGTFVSVFNLHERLDNVQLTYINHAHSDYLEILLETGLAGLGLVVFFLLWAGGTAWMRLRSNWNGPGFGMILSSTTTIGLLLVHSGLDYPLRTLALSGVMAVAMGILASPLEFHRATSSSSRYRPAGKG